MKKVKNRKILSPRDIKFRFELGINRPQKRCLKINFPVLQDDFGKRTGDHYIDQDCTTGPTPANRDFGHFHIEMQED